MTLTDRYAAVVNASARALASLQSPFMFALRAWVAWQFLKSGYLKLSSWDTTLALFADEYHVPLLPSNVAAVVGTFGELFFPALVLVGFATRLSALGMFAVNAMAVVSYAHVLFAEGFEAALAQHVLWGFMLVVIALYGPGALSLDQLLLRNVRALRAPLLAQPVGI